MGKGGGLSDSVQAGMLSNQQALVQIAQQQAGNSAKEFSAAFPGFEKAEQFYSALSSGDPYAISRAIAPGAQQADIAASSAKRNIMQNGPAGGEKNLALEQVDVNRGAQVGKMASDGFTGSFNALAQLAGQGVGESNAAAGTAISGYNSSTNTLQGVGNMQIQQKGAQLGALSSLAGDAATVGAAFI